MKDVPAIMWTALVLLASAMFFGYIFMDILSPLQELITNSPGMGPCSLWTLCRFGNFSERICLLPYFRRYYSG